MTKTQRQDAFRFQHDARRASRRPERHCHECRSALPSFNPQDATTDDPRAGFLLCVSGLLVPAILAGPSPLVLRQWKAQLETGNKTGPSLAILSAGTLISLAVAGAPSGSLIAVGPVLGLAAAAAGAILVFTVLAILPGQRRILAKLAATEGKKDGSESPPEEAERLVRKWGPQNNVRAALSAVAMVASVVATFF